RLSDNSYYAGLYLNKGQTVALFANGNTGAVGKFQLSIGATMVSTCNPMFCPIGMNGESPCCLGDMTCGLIDPTQGCVPPFAVKPGTGGTTGSGTGGFPPTNSGGTFVVPPG